MASWADVSTSAPELAANVRARFDASGLGLLATLRRDGSPRISGIEPLFEGHELWLGMMPESRKVEDLVRDPRFALHSATVDKDVKDGDAKISGRALPVDDEAAFAAFRDAHAAQKGYPPPPGPFRLFRVDIGELSMLRPNVDHLIIEWWREGGPVQRVERY